MSSYFRHVLFIIFLLFDAKCAFAWDKNVVYLAAQMGVFALILVVTVLVYLVRKEVSQNRAFNLQAMGSKPFYYRNMITGEEHISSSLKVFLGLSDYENVISSITNRFIFEDRQKFSDLYSKLMNTSNSSDGIDIYKNNPGINFELEDGPSQVGVQHLSCQHLVLKDHVGFTCGFFIFFADITSYVNQCDKIFHETDILKANLAVKNNLINLLPCPVWMRDKDLNIIYFNNEFKKMISYKENNELDCHSLEIDNKSKFFAKKAQEKWDVQCEERYIIIDGQRYLYQFFEKPISNEGMMVGMAYNITSNDIVRSDLARHIAAQANLLESTASATVIYGSDTRLQFFNQAFIKLWALDEHWLLTKPTYGQVLEKLRDKRKLPEQIDFQKFKNDQLKLFTDLMVTHNDFFYLPDGRYLRVIVIQHVLGGLLFSYEDMTDHFELERSFKTLGAVQKETIDNLNDGITIFGENGKLELSNPKFLKMWKCRKSFIESKPHISKLLSRMQRSIHSSIDWNSFKDNFILKISSRVTSNIGIELTDESIIDILFVPLPDGGILVSYHDVTDSILVAKSLKKIQQSFVS